MAKPIKITERYFSDIIEDFSKYLTICKMRGGVIEYNHPLEYKDNIRAKIYFTAKAFAKTMILIHNFDKEVAWHGTAYRGKEDSDFVIDDIFVYPQEVTGATVTTDQEKYTTWLYSFDDNIFENLRMQGHSHVNMGTTPSSTDLNHQSEILEQLNDGFYIFLIMNKKMEITTKIYDIDNNVLYETKDVDVIIEDEELSGEFLNEAKDKVNLKSYYSERSSYHNPKSSYYGYDYGYGFDSASDRLGGFEDDELK